MQGDIQHMASVFLDSLESHVRHSDLYQSYIKLSYEDEQATNDMNMLEVIEYFKGLMLEEQLRKRRLRKRIL